MTDAVGGFISWVGLFMSFGLLGLASCCFVARKYRSAWLRLESTSAPQARVGLGPAHSPHRSADPVDFGYKRSIIGIHSDARRVAWRLAFLGGLAVPGTMLGLLGILVWGIGLSAVPVIIIAIRSYVAARQLLRADTRFIEKLETNRKNLRFAGFWSLAVVGGFMCFDLYFLFFLAPVVLAALLALDTARLLPRAAQALRVNLRTRSVNEHESPKNKNPASSQLLPQVEAEAGMGSGRR